MRHFIRKLTVALSIVNILSGIFIVNLLAALDIRISNVQEVKIRTHRARL